MIIDDKGNERYGCIYGIKAINPEETTEGFYVGQAVNFKNRKTDHWVRGNKDDPDNQVVDKAIYKYGRDNFEMFIMFYCDSLQEMNDGETEMIAYFKSIGARLYNMTTGGDNCRLSQETKDKIAKAMLGKKHTEKTKQKIAKSNMGQKRPMNAKFKPKSIKASNISQEHKEAISIAHTGKIVSEKTRELLAIANVSQMKPVIAIDILGNKQNFDSMKEASRKLNVPYVSIRKILYGKQQICQGYTFRYNEQAMVNSFIIVIDKLGNEQKFESIVDASAGINISVNTISQILNGNRNNLSAKGYTFKRIIS